MLRYLIFLLFSTLVVISCSDKESTFEKNRAELDEVYGECDNPLRPLSKRLYKECIAAERAGGESFLISTAKILKIFLIVMETMLFNTTLILSLASSP